MLAPPSSLLRVLPVKSAESINSLESYIKFASFLRCATCTGRYYLPYLPRPRRIDPSAQHPNCLYCLRSHTVNLQANST